TAGGDEQMHVRMKLKSLPPRVKRREDAGQAATPLLLEHQRLDAVGRRLEQHVGEGFLVELPQHPEPVRQREDDVVVRAVEQLPPPELDPTLPPAERAQPAEAVPARLLEV